MWKFDDKSLGNVSFGTASLLMASALSPQLTLRPFVHVDPIALQRLKMKSSKIRE